METLDRFERERRQKKKKISRKSSSMIFLLKAVFAAIPVVTKVVQLAVVIKDFFR